MYSATLKHTIKLKYYQTKLEKRMLCQIWKFEVRNTIKFLPNKKRNFKKSTTLFFKTTLFFLQHFDVVFHMLLVIKKAFNRYKKCSLDKTREGNVVSDLAISPQKYPKICTQEKEKCQGICNTVFPKLRCFFTEF